MTAGLILGLAGIGVSVYCFQQQQNLPVVLVSGLDRPYAITVNGERHELAPRGASVLKVPEGDFVLADADGGTVLGEPRKFSLSRPFLSHLTRKYAAVINPDALAIVYVQDIPYYRNVATAPKDEQPPFKLLVNATTHFIDAPDFILEPAAESISMPSGSHRVVKKRLDVVRDYQLANMVRTLAANLGEDAARQHLAQLARHRSDEEFLLVASNTLAPAEFVALLRTRIAERPVLVEWHRYYQSTVDRTEPTHDLVAEYRKALAAEPANGALMYLLGRKMEDAAEARSLFEQAVRATPPCLYGHGALGFDASCEGRFADAIEHYRAASADGTSSRSRDHYRRQLYWALNQPQAIADELSTMRIKDPHDLGMMGQHVEALLALPDGAKRVAMMRQGYLDQLKKDGVPDDSIADSDKYLATIIAYQDGRLDDYARLASQFDMPAYKFRAAVARGDLAATLESIEKLPPRSSDYLVAFLLAHRLGDASNAAALFEKAKAAMEKESGEMRRVARLLAAPQIDAARVCALRIDLNEKRLLLAALGLKDPAHRPEYHALAAKLNFSPGFPQHLIREATASATAVTAKPDL